MKIYILNNRIYVKNVFDDIRDARQAKRIEKIECECGSKISKWNESHHRKTKKQWTARITINGKRINLGSFINKDDAVNIRVQRAKDEFGEFINKCELVIT